MRSVIFLGKNRSFVFQWFFFTIIIFLTISVFATESNGEDFDDPDLSYESRFHEIFLKYNSAPTPVDQWQIVVGDRNVETYPIQVGDTLWGISETLFNDGNFWPKVWSINSTIVNPHDIQPGKVLRFAPGNDADAPTIDLAEKSEKEIQQSEPLKGSFEQSKNEQSKVVSSVHSNNGVGSDGLEIPPPEKLSRPVLKKIPPSFPEWQRGRTAGEYDEWGVSIGLHEKRSEPDRVQLFNYLDENSPSTVGSVKEVETGSLVATNFQYLYVQLNKGEGRPGQRLLILQETGPLDRANEFVEAANFYGIGIEIQGIISLEEKLPPSSFSTEGEGDVFRALVVKAVNPINVGARLIRGEIESVSLTNKGPRNSTIAQIIGGTLSNKRQVFYPQSIAFLNRGSNNGLEKGQILRIRPNRKIRYENSAIKESPQTIGWIKIAKVTPRFSTAVILQAFENVSAGDFVGEISSSATKNQIEDL